MLPLLGLKLVHDRLFGNADAKSDGADTGPGKGLSDWGTHGRGLLDGPIWGHHCGAEWGGDEEPTDSLDEACRTHDDCWAGCDQLPESDVIKRMADGRLHRVPLPKACRRECDFELIASLEDLPEDPSDWPEPPAEQTDSKAHRFLKRAINWFQWF